MNISDLWAAAEKTSKLCNIIQYLRDDPNFTREDAADALIQYVGNYLEPEVVTAFNNREDNDERFAFNEERRLRQLDENYKSIDNAEGCDEE